MTVDYKKEGKIAIFTINRPDALNAINVQTNRELSDAVTDFRRDPDLWVGIITGAGDRAFCAGADINNMIPFLKEHRDHTWDFPPTIMRGLELWKPLIAAINGMALGGGLEIALACDLRIASEKARLGLPEVTLGVIPGWGGTQRLPRMIPECKAAEMMLLGKPIDAEEAYRIGLVNKVVPPDEVMPAAMEWAEVFCQLGPLAVRATKQAMIRGSGTTLEEGLKLENSLFSYILGTEDCDEGIDAFTNKRKAEFKVK